MLALQRRRFVRDRTQAIQRLRSDWTQHDPVAEAGVIRCDRQRELNKLKRIQLGSSLSTRTATRCIRELAKDIADLNARIADLDQEIAELLTEHENPLADLQGAGSNLAATIIAQACDIRRFRNASAFARFCGAAPIPCGSGKTANRHRLHRALHAHHTRRLGLRSYLSRWPRAHRSHARMAFALRMKVKLGWTLAVSFGSVGGGAGD
jgi:transposase